MTLAKTTEGALSILLITLLIGRRVFARGFSPEFSEYEAIFFYASDAILIVFLILSLLSLRAAPRLKDGALIAGGVFLLASAASIFSADAPILALSHFARLAALMGASFFIARILRSDKAFARALALIATLAVAESLIGIAQFARQESVGLDILGEPHISVSMLGVAKVAVEGGRVLRAYGTFPHPNVLAASLLIGLAAIYYFWFRLGERAFVWQSSESRSALFRRYLPILFRSIILTCALFAVLAGIALTFSRTAWVIAAILSLIAVGYWLAVGPWLFRRQSLKLVIVLAAAGFAVALMLQPFIGPRLAVRSDEPAVTLRVAYTRVGIDMVRSHPWGVGIGNQVRFAREERIYEKFGLPEPWQRQPVHNIYLLMASEIGIVGLAAFLVFAALLLGRGPGADRLQYLAAAGILGSLLLFGLSDHFLSTLPQGQLMLWVALGMVMASAKRP